MWNELASDGIIAVGVQSAMGGGTHIYIKVIHFTNFSNVNQLRVDIKKAI